MGVLLRKRFKGVCLVVLSIIFIIITLSKLFDHLYGPRGDISCHFTQIPGGWNSENLLQSIKRDGKSIFFHETSCNFHDLKPRAACAVESAARMNPDRQIYLLISAPIREDNEELVYIKLLQKFKNVHVGRIELKKYVCNTPLEGWLENGPLMRSRYRVSHTSDVLRYLTLWKYSGIYLDLDVIVVKNFDLLGNYSWSGRESEIAVAAGAISFSNDKIGREFADSAINELKYNFYTQQWGQNGPGVITRILKKVCRTDDVSKMNAGICDGFQIHPPEFFYPVPYAKWAHYFDRNHMDLIENSPKTFSYHFWNNLSHNTRINSSENVPYIYLAKKYCPNVFDQVKDYF